MTVLGKILVFVNLIFSLLTGGLIVMVYSTRTNWASALNKQSANLAIVRAQADAEYESARKAVDAKEAEVQVQKREKQAASDQLATARADLEKARQETEAVKIAQTTAGQANLASAEELKRRKDEVEKLEALVGEREKKIVEIDQQMAKLRDEAVSFKIQFETAKGRNAELLKQVQEKDQEIAAMRQQYGPGRVPPVQAQPRTPVPEDFRGTIQSVDRGLATITPGSDAGAAVGNTFQVYRLKPTPEYLGTLVIQAVTPHEAVGRLEGLGKSKVKKGDEVSYQLR